MGAAYAYNDGEDADDADWSMNYAAADFPYM